jgi:hypothetical protein
MSWPLALVVSVSIVCGAFFLWRFGAWVSGNKW